MLCPACNEDFEPQVTHCPYCGAPSPSPVHPPSEEDLGPLVVLQEIWDEATLARVSAILEAQDIPFLVQPQSSFHTLGISGLLRGEEGMTTCQEVLVPEALLADASRALTGSPTD